MEEPAWKICRAGKEIPKICPHIFSSNICSILIFSTGMQSMLKCKKVCCKSKANICCYNCQIHVEKLPNGSRLKFDMSEFPFWSLDLQWKCSLFYQMNYSTLIFIVLSSINQKRHNNKKSDAHSHMHSLGQ